MRKVTAKALLGIGLIALATSRLAVAQDTAESSPFAITLLGTGSPPPSIERFGPSTLVEVGDQRLVFDAGRGATIRLAQLGLVLSDVTAVFLTHLHSDHVVGLADIWLTGWTYPAGNRRTVPFEVYGPTGTEDMMRSLEAAHAADIRIRIADESLPAAGIEVHAHDVTGGVIYDKSGVRVSVFDVDHGELIKPALGYRVDYQGHSVVLSGDTRFSENLIAHGKGADVLVHEVMAVPPEFAAGSEAIQRIVAHHSTPEDAGRVFTETGVRLAVYSHIIIAGYPDEATGLNELARRTRTTYDGQFVIGADLLRIEVDESPRVLPRD